jgi:hypothetical protein
MSRSLTRRSVTRTPVIAALGGRRADGRIQPRRPRHTAWEHLGQQAWASYSRHADLGNGIIVYTVEGISWTVLAIAAAISFHRDRTSPRSAGPPIYVTASH